jgi:hypothetical protein
MNESRTRQDLYEVLQSLCDAIPEMRVGQILAAVGELCSDLHGRGIWDASDAEFLEAAWQFQRNLELHTAAAAQNDDA